MLSTIADVFGIISFLLTIVLLIRSESLRNQILIQKIDYKQQHPKIKIRLMALAESIREGDEILSKTKSELRQELFTYLNSFNHVLSRKDKRIINSTIKIFDKPFTPSSKNKLSKNLDYLIARFSKKEDYS